MSDIARITLNPTSHSQYSSRFIIPQRGYMIGSTAFLSLEFESNTAKSGFLPRAGAWNLIDSISILRNGEEISYTQNIGPWAALKTLSITDLDEQKRMEARSGGALHIDFNECATPSTNGGNGIWTNIPTYSLSTTNQTVNEFKPFLQLRFICDLFAKNVLVDTVSDKYELLINWLSNAGQTFPAYLNTVPNLAIMNPFALKVSSNVRLFYSASIAKIPRPIKLAAWNEVKFSSITLPALASGASDQNTIPIRFSNMPASAIFIAFVPTTPIVDNIQSASVAWGNCFSHPISWSSQNEVNIVVNGKTLLPRPITQEGQRVSHFDRALEAVGGTGTSGIHSGAINIYSPQAADTAMDFNGFWQKSCSMLMAQSKQYVQNAAYATLVNSDNYYGFSLMENSKPVMVDSSAMYLTITRGAQPASLSTPALTGYVFIISPRY